MTEPYQYQEYPKWMWHRKLSPDGRIFQSAEELASAGRGWVDSSAKLPQPTALSKAAIATLKWSGENWAKLATVIGTLLIVGVKTFFF